jgi:hypothetical protein
MKAIKSWVLRAISAAARNDRIWPLFHSLIVRPANFAVSERALTEISPDLAVKHGPFRGMKYPRRRAVGSRLVPKILGSYERELHAIVERICSERYSEIVDIGCAEGYYAVGLAMRIETARVFAYDANDEALALCNSMAELNGVADRVVVNGACEPSDILAAPLTDRTLILCDCEGYEKQLFTEEAARRFARHDLLIEIHDNIEAEISSVIRRRFESTHRITAIASIDDAEKVRSYDYEELKGYDASTRAMLLAENRGTIMEWFFMTPLER